jgi:histidine ammonia-lyase
MEKERKRLAIGAREWSIDDVYAVSHEGGEMVLSDDAAWNATMDEGAAFLERFWREHNYIYGVTTGYGNSVSVTIPPDLVEELPLHLTRFHGCGLGAHLSEKHAVAVMVVRAVSLGRGVSGVRKELLQGLCHLVNHRITPLIPEEGSVGASGDLTPLSYVAAALLGERDVIYRGKVVPAAVALEQSGGVAIQLKPKEGLALMNGTSVMTALACSAYRRAEYLTRLSGRLTAMAVEGLGGNRKHFDARLFSVKPHPGQKQVAAWVAADLGNTPRAYENKLQDRYSLRCAPHVAGVLNDALPWIKRTIEIELNSANDNPIIFAEDEEILHGGHFYGGHIAFAMDSMKNAVANIADLFDRQLALLVDTRYNNGLPANISASSTERAPINHGFKAVQIATSAWAAEALKLTMPASVFSRSTECHNQDKVSMGTISARDCLRVLELTEQVAAAHTLACFQAVAIRIRQGDLQRSQLGEGLLEMFEDIESFHEVVEEDRPLESALRSLVSMIQERRWSLYDGE